MELKKVLLLTLVVSTLMGCSAGNIPIPSNSFPEFDIEGQWAILGDANWQQEIMFDFRQTAGSDYKLKVWGLEARLDTLQVGSNQFIFSYQLDEHQSFSVLGTVLGDDQIKLSRVRESIDGFQPLGKLGEKVYYLQKVQEGEPYMLTKAPKRKPTARQY